MFSLGCSFQDRFCPMVTMTPSHFSADPHCVERTIEHDEIGSGNVSVSKTAATADLAVVQEDSVPEACHTVMIIG